VLRESFTQILTSYIKSAFARIGHADVILNDNIGKKCWNFSDGGAVRAHAASAAAGGVMAFRKYYRFPVRV
jgi:hypothetical protein